jgi:gliding motility-associated-like protein
LYSVVVTDNCSSARDEIILTQNTCLIYFPTSFTPNNDGINDVFRILDATNLNDYTLTIYNRWGQKIFETTDYTKGWDGSVNGQLGETGVYVWFCKFKKSNSAQNIEMKGTVLLIR